MVRGFLLTTLLFTLISCEGEIHTKTSTQSSRNNKVYSKKNCTKICNPKILLRTKKFQDSGLEYLSFRNFGFRGIGRCRGHALLTQKMNYLATFTVSGGCDVKAIECLNKIKNGINKILKFEPFEFAGFRNLKEFSEVPEINRYLRAIVAGTRSRYRSGKAKISSTEYNTPQLNTYYEVKKRLKWGHTPYIGIKGANIGSHAVLVYNESLIENNAVLCVRDSNHIASGVESCENYFVHGSGDKIFYHREGYEPEVITFFKLTGDEDV